MMQLLMLARSTLGEIFVGLSQDPSTVIAEITILDQLIQMCPSLPTFIDGYLVGG